MLGLASFMKRLPRLQYALALLCSSGHGVRAVITDMDAGHASVSSGCHTSSPFSFFPGCPPRPDCPPSPRSSCSFSSGLSSYLVHHRLALLSPHPQSACHATPQPLDDSSDSIMRPLRTVTSFAAVFSLSAALTPVCQGNGLQR